jgi:hypothetical protein
VKKRTLGILTAATAAALSVVLIASSASAAAPPAPPAPTTPYPAVAIDPAFCTTEAGTVTKALNARIGAVAAYNRALQAFNAGVGALVDLLTAQQAVDNATIAVNDANYAQATCQIKAVVPAPGDLNCTVLKLEFNRLTDDLVPTQDLESVFKALADIATNAYNAGVMSKADYEAAILAYQNAQAQTKTVQGQVTAAQTAATNAMCQNINRPAPAPAPAPGGGPGAGGPGGAGGSGSPAPSTAPPSGGPSTPPPSDPAPSDTATATVS